MTTPDTDALRQAFGRFMTGVTVVTARDADGTPVGFTANSFTSVSLTPPLLLVCPGAFLSSYRVFESCTHFAISVLAEGQEDISNTFAGFKGDRFARVPHQLDMHDIPVIDGAVAQFSCKTHNRLPAGDHCILIGEVCGMAHRDAPGLGYVGGRYFSLGLERAALEDSDATAICGALIEDAGMVRLEETPQGFRPPQIAQADHSHQRTHLSSHLETLGSPVHLGQAYSVFEDRAAGQHNVYYLAQARPAPTSCALTPIPISALPTLTYSTPAIADMMRRFATEAQTRNFALYLGSAERGDVHPPTTRI
ncbi:MAG: flavin reductase family protein [Sulfitobacter sp.]